MSSRSQAWKSPNFVISNWLFVILLSPLSHPPGSLGDCPANSPESSSPGLLGRLFRDNSASYLESYSGDCGEGYPPCYSESYGGSSRESSPENCSRDSPENRSGSSPENSPADSPENSWENCWAGSPTNCLWDSGCCPASRSNGGGPLLQLDDLCAEAGTGLDDIDTGLKRRAGIAAPDGPLVARAEGKLSLSRAISVHDVKKSIRRAAVWAGLNSQEFVDDSLAIRRP